MFFIKGFEMSCCQTVVVVKKNEIGNPLVCNIQEIWQLANGYNCTVFTYIQQQINQVNPWLKYITSKNVAGAINKLLEEEKSENNDTFTF